MPITDTPPSFYRDLAEDAETEAKLRATGASTPEALLSQAKAAWEAFVVYLGEDAAKSVRQRLEILVPNAGKTDPIKAPEATGALLGQPPKIPG